MNAQNAKLFTTFMTAEKKKSKKSFGIFRVSTTEMQFFFFLNWKNRYAA